MTEKKKFFTLQQNMLDKKYFFIIKGRYEKMVTISFENGKAVKATNGKVIVYNYGEGIPDSFLTRIVNTLGDEFCTVENILQLFKFCHFHILTNRHKYNIVGVFNGAKMVVVVEG